MIRIILSDEAGQHGLDVKSAISVGYGSDISDQINIIAYWNPALTEARNNQNIIALIRSTVGVAGYIETAKSVYPRVQSFFPLGSNNFTQLNIFNDPEPQVIVVEGAGKMLTKSITVMNLSPEAQVKIICENPDVRINDQEYLIIQNRYDGFNLKPDNNKYLILP